MARHCFNFPNGDILTTMGATWFVSYAYHIYVDRGHTNWREVSTHQSRASVFKTSKQHHRFFLSEIMKMHEHNVEKNTLGLKGSEIKQMAKEILQILS
jgi:hypothetical protein